MQPHVDTHQCSRPVGHDGQHLVASPGGLVVTAVWPDEQDEHQYQLLSDALGRLGAELRADVAGQCRVALDSGEPARAVAALDALAEAQTGEHADGDICVAVNVVTAALERRTGMTAPDQWVLWEACGCPVLAAPASAPRPWRMRPDTRSSIVAAGTFRREVLPALTAPCPHGPGETPPAAVDSDARHAMVLAQALGEIAAVCRTQWAVVTAWLAGELPDTPAEHVTSVLYTLPEELESARDTVLVAVRNRADRHAEQDCGSDGTQ